MTSWSLLRSLWLLGLGGSENSRASFYAGADVMLSLVFDGDDVQVQWYDDRDAVVVMKWDLEELYEGKAKEVLMRRLVENA